MFIDHMMNLSEIIEVHGFSRGRAFKGGSAFNVVVVLSAFRRCSDSTKIRGESFRWMVVSDISPRFLLLNAVLSQFFTFNCMQVYDFFRFNFVFVAWLVSLFRCCSWV